MRTDILKPLSLGFALVLAAATGCASSHVDQREAENPNSVYNKDQPAQTATYEGNSGGTTGSIGSTNKAEVQASEVGNPHSVYNKDNPAQQGPDVSTANAEVQAVEVNNPHSTDNKDQAGVAMIDKTTHDEQLRVAEQGVPDSVDDRMPSSDSVLQRLHVYDRAAIAAGQLAIHRGSATTAYAHRLVRENKATERTVVDLSRKLKASIAEPTDMRARHLLADTASDYTQLQNQTGADFDRTFAKVIAKEQQDELSAVQSLRVHCVDPQICSLLQQIEPRLQRSVEEARSLSSAVATAD